VEVLDALCGDPDFVLVVGTHPSCSPDGLIRALQTVRDMPRLVPDGATTQDPVASAARQLHKVVTSASKRLAPRRWSWLADQPLQDLHPDDLPALLTRNLSEAAADPRPAIRIAVARHPYVDDGTLAILASDEDEAVRAAVSNRILEVAMGGGSTASDDPDPGGDIWKSILLTH
jgi:hypothetical protein